MEISIKTVPSADAKPAALSPDRLEPATVLVDVEAWPGNVDLARSERRPAVTSIARGGV